MGDSATTRPAHGADDGVGHGDAAAVDRGRRAGHTDEQHDPGGGQRSGHSARADLRLEHARVLVAEAGTGGPSQADGGICGHAYGGAIYYYGARPARCSSTRARARVAGLSGPGAVGTLTL